MPLDYIILMVVGVIVIGGGLLLLREAKKYRARRHASASGRTLAGMEYPKQLRFNDALEKYWKQHGTRRHHALIDARCLQFAWKAAIRRGI